MRTRQFSITIKISHDILEQAYPYFPDNRISSVLRLLRLDACLVSV